jgi:hypothetical protein
MEGIVAESSDTPVADYVDHSQEHNNFPDIQAVTIGEFIKAHPKLNPPVVEGLVRQGETANIIASPKVGKSWLSYDLALSIATGRDWLTFQTTSGRVLLIDNELHPASIAMRIPAVADALSIRIEEYQDRIDVISLRGRLQDFYRIGAFIQQIEPGYYSAIIVDAYYRMLPGGTSENDNAQIAQIFNLIDNYAEQTAAAWFLVHHSSKGSQSEKRTTDVGSGAGSQSRAADCHLVLREHEEPGCVVLDAAVRSFPPVEPVVLEWTFPIWQPIDHLDPGKLKGRLTKNQQRQQENDDEGKLDIVDILRKWNTNEDGKATPNQIIGKSPYGKEKTRSLLAKLMHSGDVTREPIIIRGNNTHEYSLTEDDSE